MAGCVRGGKGAGGRSLQRVVHALRTDGIVSERFSYGSKADRYTEKEFNRVFTQLLKDTDQLGNDDLLGVVKRYGVITARICCIFSAIDKGTMRMETPEVYCSDAHFKAALAIVLCCFEHSKLVSTSVKSSAEDTKPLQSPDNLSRLLTKLKRVFQPKKHVLWERN